MPSTDPIPPPGGPAQPVSTALFGVALFVCMLLGLLVRMEVVRDVARPAATLGAAAPDDLPFSRESAIQFRRLRQYYQTGGLPERDPAIQWPEGVDIARTYTLGSNTGPMRR
ncbi:MAG: hypothetical protein U1F77_02665 [Kiritimatiellia bacterium]